MRGNMNETPVCFDMIPAKSICKTGSKEYVASTSSCERRHVITVLWAIPDGKLLPPMIFYYLQRSNKEIIQRLRVPERFIIKTQEKAKMDERLILVWVKDIWVKHTYAMSEKLGFDNLLLTFDAFSAHKIVEIQGKLIEKKTDTLMIPPGCTSKYQSMDGCISKPFKAILQKCWVEYVSEMINEEHVQLPPPSRQEMVDWLEKAFSFISNDT